MKKTIILASVAIATLFAFSSCQKEEIETTSVSGVRIITAEFENNGTKTTLNADGKTPKWETSDMIRILNETTYQDITLAASNITDNKITFKTTLTGTLYAVYPASATTMTSCSDGKITFTIPAVQDGKFGSANICVAKSSTTDGTNKDHLVFSNATSVLEFRQTAATTQVLIVRVEAANAIAGPMTVNYKSDGTFDTPTTSSLTGKTIKVKPSTAKDKYYIAVAPVATGKIEFEYQKAVEVATVTTEAGKTLAANTIYTCPMDGQTYVIKEGFIDGYGYVQVGSVKWATMNVGATTVADSYETCYGDLYQWGSVRTLYDGFPYTSATAGSFTWKTGKTSGFVPDNREYTGWDPTLPLSYDAAYAQWGTNWRMPTRDEFVALFKACGKTGSDCVPTSGSIASTAKGVYWCSSYNSVAGCLFIVKDNGPHLFFPAAGDGNGTSLTAGADSFIHYWSSSLDRGNIGQAYHLFFHSNLVNPQLSYDRYHGLPVRPVSD